MKDRGEHSCRRRHSRQHSVEAATRRTLSPVPMTMASYTPSASGCSSVHVCEQARQRASKRSTYIHTRTRRITPPPNSPKTQSHTRLLARGQPREIHPGRALHLLLRGCLRRGRRRLRGRGRRRRGRGRGHGGGRRGLVAGGRHFVWGRSSVFCLCVLWCGVFWMRGGRSVGRLIDGFQHPTSKKNPEGRKRPPDACMMHACVHRVSSKFQRGPAPRPDRSIDRPRPRRHRAASQPASHTGGQTVGPVGWVGRSRG